MVRARATQNLGVAMGGRAPVHAIIKRHVDGRAFKAWRLGWSSFLWNVTPA